MARFVKLKPISHDIGKAISILNSSRGDLTNKEHIVAAPSGIPDKDIIGLFYKNGRWLHDCDIQSRDFSISYAIVTIARQGNYIHQTVASLQNTGLMSRSDATTNPLHIFVGSSDSSYLDQYRNSQTIVIDEFPDDLLQYQLHSAGQKVGINHYNCISRMTKLGSDLVMAMEDDIHFSEGWLPYVKMVIKDIQRLYGLMWTLTLFLSSHSPLDYYKSQKKWYIHHYDGFSGLLAMVYPNHVALEFSEYVLENNIEHDRGTVDCLLGKFLKEKKIPLIATAPCLVQHIGRITSGGGGGGITTPSFVASV